MSGRRLATEPGILGNSSNVSSSKIDDIYELCVEKIIREQAEQFYKNFPIKSIVLQLLV